MPASSVPLPVGRFAPSPSGRLHLGNIFSYLVAYLQVKQEGGHMVMRIEDLDQNRCKLEYVTQVLSDLEWLGFEWEGDILYQSTRTDAYQQAFQTLQQKELIYPCFCSRVDLQSAQAPHEGEETRYVGTCRALTKDKQLKLQAQKHPSYRVIAPDKTVVFEDIFQGHQEQNPACIAGDFVVQRADGVFAYQLAVILDDAYQEVTSVIRGVDLLPSVSRQQFLLRTLALPYQDITYGHVPLLVDNEGRRLSKRNQDLSLSYFREVKRYTAHDILGLLAYTTGLIPEAMPVSLVELVNTANLDALTGKTRIPIYNQMNN